MVKRGKAAARRNAYAGYYHAMMLPGMAFLIVFSYFPMLGIVMAFQDYVPAKGFLHSEWVGLSHFKHLLEMSDIWLITRNTVVIALGKIILGIIVPVIFSILLNEINCKSLKKGIQTITYIPHFISWVILSYIIINLFGYDGMINQLLSNLGLSKVNFLGSNKLFQPLLILTDTWKEFGYGSIVYLAAITSVDPCLHEAAALDGAGWWRRVWHVTLPAMAPVIVLMTAMGVSGILNAGFDQVYNLYSPRVYETGDILDTYVYRVCLISRRYSFGTAVGLLKSIVGMTLLASANQFAQKVAHRRIF